MKEELAKQLIASLDNLTNGFNAMSTELRELKKSYLNLETRLQFPNGVIPEVIKEKPEMEMVQNNGLIDFKPVVKPPAAKHERSAVGEWCLGKAGHDYNESVDIKIDSIQIDLADEPAIWVRTDTGQPVSFYIQRAGQDKKTLVSVGRNFPHAMAGLDEEGKFLAIQYSKGTYKFFASCKDWETCLSVTLVDSRKP